VKALTHVLAGTAINAAKDFASHEDNVAILVL
jgi:hypothetical protein